MKEAPAAKFERMLNNQIQKIRNSQIRPKHKWWMFRKRVYCTECFNEKNDIGDVMFGVAVTFPLCGVPEKDKSCGSYLNRYRKNKRHNCKDFKEKIS
jgi:hypothetical protein